MKTMIAVGKTMRCRRCQCQVLVVNTTALKAISESGIKPLCDNCKHIKRMEKYPHLYRELEF